MVKEDRVFMHTCTDWLRITKLTTSLTRRFSSIIYRINRCCSAFNVRINLRKLMLFLMKIYLLSSFDLNILSS